MDFGFDMLSCKMLLM